MSVESSVEAQIISDRTLSDSPTRLSPREPLSKQNDVLQVNNPRLSSIELLAKKMLERERVWSMDAEQVETITLQLADEEDGATERVQIEEEKREQERMAFEAAELELRRKQQEKRRPEEVKPLVEGSKMRQRQSSASNNVAVGGTTSSSKEATQATVSSALQKRRKGVPVRPDSQADQLKKLTSKPRPA
jgi:hypothetical protein